MTEEEKERHFSLSVPDLPGLAAASELARLLPDSSNGDIVLIDEDNFLLFTPMLTEAAREKVGRRQSGSRAPRDVQTILINPGDRLLNEITPDLALYAAGKLKQHGVQIRMKTKVSAAAEGHVEVNGSERIPTRTLIWAAGVKPNPIVEPLSCEKGRHGGIKVDGCCQVPEHPGIWAMGDCAEIPRPHGKGAYAPTAQNASRERKQVARNIVASLHGLPARPFNYTPIGELALVGRHSGVARVYGHNFSGPLAWAMWRAIYLFKMPGTGQKARILSDWVLDLIFGRDPIATNQSTSAYKGKHDICRAV